MAWLTPETLPTSRLCRQLSIPDDIDIIAAVTGALLDLTRVENWEEFGAVLPDEIASAMIVMIMEFWEGCPVSAILKPTILADQQASGVNGGSATSGSWQIRNLGLILADPEGLVTATGGQTFTLQPDRDYYIRAKAQVNSVNRHMIRLWDVDGAAVAILGNSHFASGSGEWATLEGFINTAANQKFRVEHRVQTSVATTGYGVATSFGVETYVKVEIIPL